jgi:hypothetical protein
MDRLKIAKELFDVSTPEQKKEYADSFGLAQSNGTAEWDSAMYCKALDPRTGRPEGK